MAERAKLVDTAAAPELDVSGFAPKQPARQPEADLDAIREASAKAGLVSREPSPKKKPLKNLDRRRRTGRNIQLSAKISERAQKLLDEIYEAHRDKENWTIGQILEFSLEAFKRDLENPGVSLTK